MAARGINGILVSLQGLRIQFHWLSWNQFVSAGKPPKSFPGISGLYFAEELASLLPESSLSLPALHKNHSCPKLAKHGKVFRIPFRHLFSVTRSSFQWSHSP